MEEFIFENVWLVIAATALFAFTIGRMVGSGAPSIEQEAQEMVSQQHAEEAFSALSPTTQDEVDHLITEGKVIEAIKTIRTESGYGLRQAKAIADNRRRMLKGA
ncbi:MAG: hypothetical protein AAGJ73_07305 [Pseudomonadota bacterium]